MLIQCVKSLVRRLPPSTSLDLARWIARPGIRQHLNCRDYLRVCHLARKRQLEDNRSKNLLVTVKSFANLPVMLRCGTSDASVLLETIIGLFHLPPAGVSPKVIWDLGANIGLTAAHFAVCYPDAKVYAVEANPDLATIANQNTSKWRDRIQVIEAAVWSENAELQFSVKFGDEYGGQVTSSHSGISVQGRSLNSLFPGDDIVDFVKMDIEGAERQVLQQQTQWAARVHCIKVECHGDYSRDNCISDLEALGFEATADDRHWNCVIGRRARS